MVTPADNNYAPPKSAVADVSTGDEALATRGSRLGAAIVDGLLYTIPAVPAYIAAMPQLAHMSRGVGGVGNLVTVWMAIGSTGPRFYLSILGWIVVGLINAILVHKNAQSIGKKLFGIKVSRKDGSRATLARIFLLRNVLNSVIMYAGMFLLPLFGNLYNLVDSLFIFGNARRCVHDYLADTIVIKA